MSFRAEARAAQVRWKATSETLPPDARAPGRYNRHEYAFCLPPEFAEYNLLPEARDAVDDFTRDQIHWHRGTKTGPTNHLCSSQVQCVNALYRFRKDAAALRWLFGEILRIADVEPFDGETLVEFEWVGTDDLLGEFVDGKGTRGAHTTSADAAIAYRGEDGAHELALIEWKYTETYGDGKPLGGTQATRDQRYRKLYERPDGPIFSDKAPYEELYFEPVYQLFRMTLLAGELERRGRYDRVRVLYCAPSRNTSLWTSLRDSHKAVAPDLATFWSAMQRDTYRFPRARHRPVRVARRANVSRIQVPVRASRRTIRSCRVTNGRTGTEGEGARDVEVRRIVGSGKAPTGRGATRARRTVVDQGPAGRAERASGAGRASGADGREVSRPSPSTGSTNRWRCPVTGHAVT